MLASVATTALSEWAWTLALGALAVAGGDCSCGWRCSYLGVGESSTKTKQQESLLRWC